jgi:hypothetical protein
MGWPQYVYAGLLCLALGMSLAKHGELKTGSEARHSFFTSAFSAGLAWWLLWMGGFWS